MKLSISMKLNLLFLTILGFFVFAVMFSENQLEDIHQKGVHISYLGEEKEALQSLYAGWTKLFESTAAYLLYQSAQSESELIQKTDLLGKQIEDIRQIQMRDGDQEMFDLMTKMGNLFAEYQREVRSLRGQVQAGHHQQAVNASLQLSQKTIAEKEALFKEYHDLIESRISAAHDDSEEQLSTSRHAGWTFLVVVCIFFALTGLTMMKQVSRPLQKLNEAAQKFSSGDTTIRVDIRQNDEIGSLAASFNQMAYTIQKQLKYLDELPTPVMAIDTDFNVQYMNKAGAAFVGKPVEACKSEKCYRLFKTGHCQTADCRLAQAIQAGEVRSGETVSAARPQPTPIAYTGAPVKDDRGEVAGGIEFVLDISENKKLIREIQERENYLEESARELLAAMEQFSNGDLGVHLPVQSNDTIGRLFAGFNQTVAKTREVIETLNDTVQSTANASAEISTSADQLAAAAAEQSSQSQEVASAVEEMVQTVVENARNTTRAAKAAESNQEVARRGAETVQQTLSKIQRISEVIKSSAETVQKLGQSGEQIGAIITVIEDIADQINLLALNAAIEAARAGEQGRGFAVVADEVRVLAEKTAGSTKQISEMIKNIQAETEIAVTSMIEGEKEVAEGMSLADQAGGALSKIVESVQEVMDMTARIATANEQQSTTSQEIAQSIESISTVSSDAAEQIGQIAAATEGLNRLAQELSEVMNKFNFSRERVELMG